MNKKIVFIIIGILLLGALSAMIYFLMNDDSGCEKPIITLSSSNPYENDKIEVSTEVEAEKYEWYVDNKLLSEITGPSGQLVATGIGKHTIKLTINGTCTSDEVPFEVMASTSASEEEKLIAIEGPSDVKVDDEVQYTVKADNATAYSWTFMESNKGAVESKEQSPSIKFTYPGKRDISVGVTIKGKIIRKSKSINVIKVAPQPAPGPNTPPAPSPAIMENDVKNKLNGLYEDYSKNSGNVEYIANKALCKDYNVMVDVIENGTLKSKTFGSYIKSVALATIKARVQSVKITKDKGGCVSKMVITQAK